MTIVPERPAPAPDLYAEADIRQAARALLQTPLLHNDQHHDDLALVRRHRGDLAKLFSDGLGYRLVIEPGLARLYKAGLGKDGRRGLRRRNGNHFTPRSYAMLALLLAALTRSRSQIMVDELVAGVRSAAVDAGVDVDLDALAERRALYAALIALIEVGVISERDGDLEHWAERRTDSLLDVHRDRLAVVVAAPLSRCAMPEEVFAVDSIPSSAGGSRVPIRRRLVEQPVLSVDELTDEQRGWWRRNRHREVEWFSNSFGLDLELRAEGATAIDPSGEMTDRAFPGTGSATHFALLLLAELVEEVRADTEADLTSVPRPRLATSTARVVGDRVFETWKRGLRKEHRENSDLVYDEAIEILTDVGLIRRDASGIQIHAAAARYAPKAEIVGPRQAEATLFDEDEPEA